MADSAKLYINPQKWDNKDAVDLVHVTVNQMFGETKMPEIKYDGANFGMCLFMYYTMENGPGMVMITMSAVGGIPALMIDISANREEKTKFLRKIAEKIGGMYIDRDNQEFFEEFRDNFREDEDFMLKEIQKEGKFYDILGERRNNEIDELIEHLQKMKKA